MTSKTDSKRHPHADCPAPADCYEQGLADGRAEGGRNTMSETPEQLAGQWCEDWGVSEQLTTSLADLLMSRHEAGLLMSRHEAGLVDGMEAQKIIIADLRAQLATAKADGAREEAARWEARLMCDSIDSLCPECGSCTWGRPYVDLKPDLSRRVCSQCDAIRPEPATPEEDETP